MDPFSDRIQMALVFAADAHKAQQRRYTGEPYIVHLIEVMMLVREYGGSENQQIAALLHDTLEDTVTDPSQIQHTFGIPVLSMVQDLTDQCLFGNREERKAAEATRLGTIAPEAQTIKYADLISNTRSIVEHAPDFAKLYLAEKRRILSVMTQGDSRLYWLACSLVRDDQLSFELPPG